MYYFIQWLPYFVLGLVVGGLILLSEVDMEVTGSVGLVVLESFKHTLCWHLVHSGILDVEVLVIICRNLVYL